MINSKQASPTIWQLLALSDDELETADVVETNLAVAKEIPSLKDLDVARFRGVVDEWTDWFRHELPGMERRFHGTPERWKNDIRFFRIGMLQGFLGHIIGIRYIDEQKLSREVWYTDPSDLFLNGVIERKQGTCGNMAALHVAIARRMGWPVSLACAGPHFISRYDDGRVIHNIEATSTQAGTFASDPDEAYVKRFNLPRLAITCGSDLCRLSARQMIGIFLALRGRHYRDVKDLHQADASYSLARALFPQYRRLHIAAMVPMIHRGSALFDSGELGHPDSLFKDLAPALSPHIYRASVQASDVSVHWYKQPVGATGAIEVMPAPPFSPKLEGG